MTIILSIPSQEYAPQTITRSQAIPASVKCVRLSFTNRENWPLGTNYVMPNTGEVKPNTVMAIRVTMPDGSPGGGTTFSGGPLFRDATGKKLRTVAEPGTDIPVTTEYYELVRGIDLPAGAYTFVADVLVTVSAGLIIEAF